MSTSPDADSIAMLTAMGFERSQAVEALSITGGNLEQAANYLLGGGPPSGGGSSNTPPPYTVSSASSAAVETIHGSTSQYASGGQSACTCIALTAAEQFLRQQPAAPVINTPWLDEAVTAGVAIYQKLKGSSRGEVEHLSAEEVLQAGIFPSLQTGAIRQGILSGNGTGDATNGLQQLLSECRLPSQWACVLMTKTPETVLLCLPPMSSSDDSGFWLIDSHPRPQFSAAQGSCYARKHASLPDLVQSSLQTIFPFTELGSDVPEMMAVMYNSFDLYPLRLASLST